MKKLLSSLLVLALCLVIGCAGLGKFSTSGGATVKGIITIADNVLHGLDTFYDTLVGLKLLPDLTSLATTALQKADDAAAALKKIIDGQTTDAVAQQTALEKATALIAEASAIAQQLQAKKLTEVQGELKKMKVMRSIQ